MGIGHLWGDALRRTNERTNDRLPLRQVQSDTFNGHIQNVAEWSVSLDDLVFEGNAEAHEDREPCTTVVKDRTLQDKVTGEDWDVLFRTSRLDIREETEVLFDAFVASDLEHFRSAV